MPRRRNRAERRSEEVEIRRLKVSGPPANYQRNHGVVLVVIFKMGLLLVWHNTDTIQGVK